MGVSAAGSSDFEWMARALELARRAGARGEVPVGAVMIDVAGHMIAATANSPIELHDASAHAEILALRSAGRHAGNYRLPGSTMFVTLEPCAMCAAALVHARVERLVFAARDPKAGACGSVLDITCHPALNHRVNVEAGPLAEESTALLQAFFRARRRGKADCLPS